MEHDPDTLSADPVLKKERQKVRVPKVVKASFCSGPDCCDQNKANWRGRPISVGSYLNKCPNCNRNEFLYHELVGKGDASRILKYMDLK